MPAQPAFPPAHTPPFPALYLYPLNDSFVPKHISLVGGQRVKIGRQTNAKTVPGERNGYFDSKVLSRQHAEVWEEGGKIYIKDVKSSNGTFINGERLSPEGVESEPYELKTDDIVEFGIDIVGEDNKTIIHHKVAARVTCIFTAEEALATQREAYNFQQQSQQSGPPSTLNAAQRRTSIQPPTNGVGIMGGMGGGARQPGRSGLSFEHIMSKLQSELSKSREAGAELNQVMGTMSDIENVLNGNQPPNLPPYPQLPPVRPPQQHVPQPQPQDQEVESSSVALQALQAQLAETQASLSSHVEKFRTLESLLSDHDAIRREVNNLRLLMEEQREHQRSNEHHIHEEEEDDDRRSIHTITPHELESVPEEDETEAEESEEERHARREELGRPRTPEPSSLGMREDDEDREHQLAPTQPPGISDELMRRLTYLSEQLESALELSRSLQAQHASAQQTIESLENKVSALEDLVAQTRAAKAAEDAKIAEEAAQRAQEEKNDMVSLFTEFKKTIEQRWEAVKTDWETERERMEKARGEWEARVKGLEDGVAGAANKFEMGLAGLATQLAGMKANGYISGNGPVKHKGGLVTPPSPRSLSDADSDSDEPHSGNGPKGTGRRRSRSSSRSRRLRVGRSSRSHSPATSASASTTLVDGMSMSGSQVGTDSSVGSVHSRRSSSDSPVTGTTDVDSAAASPSKARFPRFLPTPGASVHLDENGAVVAKTPAQEVQPTVTNGQIALGIFVVGFATAAVLWRVKE